MSERLAFRVATLWSWFLRPAAPPCGFAATSSALSSDAHVLWLRPRCARQLAASSCISEPAEQLLTPQLPRCRISFT
jgi:hypothetical protein